MKATGYGIAAADFAIASSLSTDPIFQRILLLWALLAWAGLAFQRGRQ